MGSLAPPQSPRHTEIELAPLTDTSGEVELLVREHEAQGLDRYADHAQNEQPWPWFVIPVLVAAVSGKVPVSRLHDCG